MKIEKLMWASTDQLRQEMVSKINEIIDKVNEPVEMNSPAQRNGALSGKKEECARCEFDKLPGEYTLPFNYEIPHSCKEDKKEEPKSTLREDIKEILCEAMFLKTEYLDPTGNKDADKIISLFKDTLLKEVGKVVPGKHIRMDSELSQTYTEAKVDITNLIKNI